MLKVAKFGGSSVAGAEQFRKVKAIVEADESRRVIVISAAGKRDGNDHKLTDLLYLVHAHLTYGVSCEEILRTVETRLLEIRDELELPIGTVSLKWSGGLGGHNGLRSTKAVLNTPDFFRLRFGIGRPDNDKISVADYVLSRFTPEQQELMQNVFSQTNLLRVKLLLSKEPKDLIQSWGKKNLI